MGVVYSEEEEIGYINYVVRLRVYIFKVVEVFMRFLILVGVNVVDWYEYMEVEDDEFE